MSDGPVEIEISNEFAKAGVKITLGAITYSVPEELNSEKVEEAFNQATERAAARVAEKRSADLEEIATTRQAFKALGKDPSRYRPSSEALYRRIATGKGLWRVNDIVDANNIMSLDAKWPVGNYDLAKIEPPVKLRLGRSGEPYVGVGRSDINIECLTVLSDLQGSFGAPFSDSERTKVTPQTRHVMSVLYVYGDAQGMDALIKRSVETLKNLLGASKIEVQTVIQTETL